VPVIYEYVTLDAQTQRDGQLYDNVRHQTHNYENDATVTAAAAAAEC